jgi:hypothetical protein
MNELVKRTEVFNCYSEAAALDLIEKAKEDKTCVVEHAIKYKAKKDRKTGEIVEETWVTTITKKFVI